MKVPYECSVGLTYIRAGRRGRRKDRFMSFISGMSMASIALGVAALIIVLSVMNGFQKEVRDRMLGVIPHVEVYAPSGEVTDWAALEKKVDAVPGVVKSAPFVNGQGLVSSGRVVRGALFKGIDPASEGGASDLLEQIVGATPDALKPGQYGVFLGIELARALHVRLGDKVALLVPEGNITPAGMIPRMKQFRVQGFVSSGHYEYDSTLVVMHIKDAAALMQTGGPQGLRVKTNDIDAAPAIAASIQASLPIGYWTTDWSKQNRTWFAAVQVEKRMMGIILFLIVVVGAFGLVSSLVMTVKEKRADIAILRTLGASSRSVMAIFVIQGAVVGALGVVAGVAAGLLVAYNVDAIVSTIEAIFHVQFLPKEIYFISSMPSDPRLSDIVPIAAGSFVLSLLATLYPSWRAAKTEPAEALRYE